MRGWHQPVELTNGIIEVFDEGYALKFHELDPLLPTAGWSFVFAMSEKAS